MGKSVLSNKMQIAVMLIASTLAVLQGCNTQQVNVLQGISVVPGQTLAVGTPINLVLNGNGTCQSVNVDWGDGDTEVYSHISFPITLTGDDASSVALRTLTHTFTGWGGGKTITVTASSGCIGQANVRFSITPLSKIIGWGQPGPA
jgi:hypothetical protein